MPKNTIHAVTTIAAVPILGTMFLYAIALAHAAGNAGTGNAASNLNSFLGNPLGTFGMLLFLQVFTSMLFLIAGNNDSKLLVGGLYGVNAVLLLMYLVFMGIALTPNGIAGLMSWLMVPISIPVWVCGLAFAITNRNKKFPQGNFIAPQGS